MVSHPDLGSDPLIGSDRETGCDSGSLTQVRRKALKKILLSHAGA